MYSAEWQRLCAATYAKMDYDSYDIRIEETLGELHVKLSTLASMLDECKTMGDVMMCFKAFHDEVDTDGHISMNLMLVVANDVGLVPEGHQHNFDFRWQLVTTKDFIAIVGAEGADEVVQITDETKLVKRSR